MSKSIYLIIMFPIFCFSQIEVSNSQYSFGGSMIDEIKDVARVSDGYLLLLSSTSGADGNKTLANFGDEDFWLVKTDFSYNIQWQEVYGGSLQDRPYDILELSDGNYLLSGLSSSGISGNKTTPNNGYEDFYCVKVDGTGNIIWDITFGGDSTDVAFCTIELNNEIYIVGQTFSGISGNKMTSLKAKSDCWIIKIDLGGNKIWEKTYGGDEVENQSSITSISNLLFVAIQSNSTASFDKTITTYGDMDSWVLKLDTSGTILDQNVFGGDTYDANPIIVSDGTDLLLSTTSLSGTSGNKSSSNFGVVDYWLLKIDTTLNIIFDYVYGGDDADECYGLSILNNGDYCLYGRSRSNISGIKTSNNFDQIGIPVPKYDIWFLGLDTIGNVLWQSTFGGINNDNPIKIIEDPNYILNILGYSSSNQDGNKTSTQYGLGDGWVIKLETNLSINENSELISIVAYPNPTNSIIQLENNSNSYLEMELVDQRGNLLRKFSLKKHSQYQLDLDPHPTGVYYLKSGSSKTIKIVKQ
ncbi:MAG: T9SS type A sorting domain-containing protein [Crocinitomicaceae bacterium]